MRLYTIAIEGMDDDEVISDSYKFEDAFGGIVFKVKSRLVAKNQTEVDVGCGNAFGGQAEEEAGGAKQDTQKVNDIIDSFCYNETTYDLKAFVGFMKEYAKKYLPKYSAQGKEKQEEFKTNFKAFVEWVKNDFSNFGFYTTKNYAETIILSYFEGEDAAPTFVYLADSLKMIKV